MERAGWPLYRGGEGYKDEDQRMRHEAANEASPLFFNMHESHADS